MIAKMRKCDLATNTIATYVRIFKVFLSWAREEGFSNLTIPKYRTEETIKEVYTDEELKILLP
jgi:integrase/recombinase XerD